MRPDGFPCKSCGAPFSTQKTMSRHFALCPKRGGAKRKHETVKNNSVSANKRVKNEASPSSLGSPPPAAAATATTFTTSTKSSWQTRVDRYKPVCKVGDYTCPLCLVRFRLNQPYGRHVKDRECQRGRTQDARPPPRNRLAMINITIHPGIKGDDTVVGYNRVSGMVIWVS